MLDQLLKIEEDLPTLLSEAPWDSLIINRRKPETYRLFTQIGENRLCLHRFSPCASEEAFWHPHPWPAAFKILSGSYEMGLKFDNGVFSGDVSRLIMSTGSYYEISSPNTWHKISPLSDHYVFTIMLNGANFPNPHPAVRTTKGKDLGKIGEVEKADLIDTFKKIIEWSIYD
jgi:hypothetical protein